MDIILKILFNRLKVMKTSHQNRQCHKCSKQIALLGYVSGLDKVPLLCHECANDQATALSSQPDGNDHQDSSSDSDETAPLNGLICIPNPFYKSPFSSNSWERDESFDFDPNKKKWDHLRIPFWMSLDLTQLPEDDDEKEYALLAEWEYMMEAAINKQRAAQRESLRRKSKQMKNKAKKQKLDQKGLTQGKSICLFIWL